MTDGWGSWEDDARRKRTASGAATPAERLAWLEAMLELALARGAIPKRRDAWGQPLPLLHDGSGIPPTSKDPAGT
jgi:hypothetical protein